MRPRISIRGLSVRPSFVLSQNVQFRHHYLKGLVAFLLPYFFLPYFLTFFPFSLSIYLIFSFSARLFSFFISFLLSLFLSLFHSFSFFLLRLPASLSLSVRMFYYSYDSPSIFSLCIYLYFLGSGPGWGRSPVSRIGVLIYNTSEGRPNLKRASILFYFGSRIWPMKGERPIFLIIESSMFNKYAMWNS